MQKLIYLSLCVLFSNPVLAKNENADNATELSEANQSKEEGEAEESIKHREIDMGHIFGLKKKIEDSDQKIEKKSNVKFTSSCSDEAGKVYKVGDVGYELCLSQATKNNQVQGAPNSTSIDVNYGK